MTALILAAALTIGQGPVYAGSGPYNVAPPSVATWHYQPSVRSKQRRAAQVARLRAVNEAKRVSEEYRRAMAEASKPLVGVGFGFP